MRGGTAAAVVFLLLGLALIARTIESGVGGGLGLMLGALFVAAGGLRLYLSRR